MEVGCGKGSNGMVGRYVGQDWVGDAILCEKGENDLAQVNHPGGRGKSA